VVYTKSSFASEGAHVGTLKSCGLLTRDIQPGEVHHHLRQMFAAGADGHEAIAAPGRRTILGRCHLPRCPTTVRPVRWIHDTRRDAAARLAKRRGKREISLLQTKRSRRSPCGPRLCENSKLQHFWGSFTLTRTPIAAYTRSERSTLKLPNAGVRFHTASAGSGRSRNCDRQESPYTSPRGTGHPSERATSS
jgi:hypothetical protein